MAGEAERITSHPILRPTTRNKSEEDGPARGVHPGDYPGGNRKPERWLPSLLLAPHGLHVALTGFVRLSDTTQGPGGLPTLHPRPGGAAGAGRPCAEQLRHLQCSLRRAGVVRGLGDVDGDGCGGRPGENGLGAWSRRGQREWEAALAAAEVFPPWGPVGAGRGLPRGGSLQRLLLRQLHREDRPRAGLQLRALPPGLIPPPRHGGVPAFPNPAPLS